MNSTLIMKYPDDSAIKVELNDEERQAVEDLLIELGVTTEIVKP